jgi:hypothetical protein
MLNVLTQFIMFKKHVNIYITPIITHLKYYKLNVLIVTRNFIFF